MTRLHGKVAIITGASSGIGRATARLFAREGASVVLNARGVDALESVAEEIRRDGGQAAAIPGDVTLADTHMRLVETALECFGRLDIAINNAGTVGQIAPLADLDPDSWNAVLSGNLTSAFLAARVQIPAMLKTGGGALVFVSSFVGTSVGLPGMAAYGAAKAGLMGLVKGITADYAAVGVRANALLPGGTDTAMAGDQAQKDWAASLHALKRIAEPEEIAAAALFLAGPMGSFVAGSALYADGGNSAVK
ncbi:NAD(P)-dependent dehydrogenase (short-subunit alcohol dehydrogenase family) [Rhizobium rosettiformans]|uniref:SDR family oxidoreductase n=2 Tax=Rhizobium rosettiformans TaxID=1368430 RepID=A0A4S8PZW9_9HYPH|nr:SDR family oxidoreductase [Rhizobium rosettiformans]MBB5275574.1 NAD(P)-dependent dehydrogenase (short-subunit alcohol dehydrogenase family) [Rhizobium rosettiformans]THV37327.1 SDR family oxidoreductase [Rhizobium rosettiformans W3]